MHILDCVTLPDLTVAFGILGILYAFKNTASQKACFCKVLEMQCKLLSPLNPIDCTPQTMLSILEDLSYKPH